MSETIPVALAEHWRVYLQGLVQNRRFASVDDAVESALRLLEAHESADDRLARLLEEGEATGGFAEWDYDAFKAEMHQRHDARKAA
ncbi:ribbon-helix-helix domain-containing protein [Sphingomonas sp.]|jgi:putative addiction module CopG family antidote|uniref:ribbon-helix-helix domain-containing protein n=1 Tax=Sphingomonas sp. TaxID=28214 RepID=UPI002D804A28|nr:type II toxin-antitoxin system ParD family antitoxin [Sphingomonas sp.]HEU0043110.1 type II toxin-antitoxin system ParD family antitoxin [Sphingomonas sp.]